MTDTPWYQGVEGIDTEMTGHLQTKGWDKLTAPLAAAAALKAYKEVERHVGAPPEQIIRLPKDMNDSAAMTAVWERLGAPKEAKDYDFSSVKRADGTEPDTKFTDFVRATAAELKLPKDTATRIATSLLKFQTEAEAAGKADHQAKVALEKDTLAKNWGANKETHMFVAKKAAEALGISAEEVTALESVIGYSKVMEMFRNIGSKIGEDKFVKSDADKSGLLTREQAVAKLADLKKDTGWVQRYLAGDTQAKREADALHTIIAG